MPASEQNPSRGKTIAIYTALRFALFVVVWLLLELLSPLRGWWALATAILVSGMISAFALNRQRDDMSVGVASFFSGMNARIEAANQAEDARDEAIRAQLLAERAPAGDATDEQTGRQPSDGEQETDGEAVAEDEHPGVLQDGDERATGSTGA